jgi:hypothetical protein
MKYLLTFIMVLVFAISCLAMSEADFEKCMNAQDDNSDFAKRINRFAGISSTPLSISNQEKMIKKFAYSKRKATNCEEMLAGVTSWLDILEKVNTAAVEEGDRVLTLLLSPEHEATANDRQTACANSLDHYLAATDFDGGLEHYLLMQYELTTYRIFGSFLAQRVEQTKAYKAGKRTELPITRFSDMLQDHINYLEKSDIQDAEFVAAKMSFQQSPLSIATLAKLAPFIDRSIVQRSDIYAAGIGANFRLDEMDYRLLNLLVTIDDQREIKRSANFITKIESLDATQISDYDAEVNLEVLNYKKISQSKNDIPVFLNWLEIPDGCHTDKADVARKLLSDTILSRDDMKEFREEQGSDFIYYTGKSSPWGSVELGTFIP